MIQEKGYHPVTNRRLNASFKSFNSLMLLMTTAGYCVAHPIAYFRNVLPGVTMEETNDNYDQPTPDNSQAARWRGGRQCTALIEAFTQVVTTMTSQCKWKNDAESLS